MNLPIAHPGHWIINLLYALPVLLLVLALVRQKRVEARREAEEAVSGPAGVDRGPDPLG